jgi:hypothetical protein
MRKIKKGVALINAFSSDQLPQTIAKVAAVITPFE